MNSQMILDGKSVMYLIGVIPARSVFISSQYEYVLGKVEKDGSIKLKKVFTEKDLVDYIKKGKVIQNVNVKEDKLVFKGNHDITHFSVNSFAFKICLAEVTSEYDEDTSYLIVERSGKFSIVNKERMIELTKINLIDNYHLTGNGSLRRNPGQEISHLICTETAISDTYWGMSNKDLMKVLKFNGFKLGYKSEEYTTIGYRGEPESWVSYGWYDSNGAIVWYNCYKDRYNGKDDPFYAGAYLYIDADVRMSPTDLMANNIPLGQSYSNHVGHQRLYMDAREGLFRKYKLMLKAVKGYVPWNYHDTETDSMNLMDHDFQRRDIFEKLKGIAYSMPNAPSEKEDSMFLYSIYSDVSMFYTVQKFDGELKNILSEWEVTFKERLARNIAKDIVFGISRKREKLIEMYLNKIGMVLPRPLSEYVKEERERKKKLDEERERKWAKSKNPFLSNIKGRGFESLQDLSLFDFKQRRSE